MTRNRFYRDGRLVEEDVPVDRAAELLAEPDTVAWLDLAAPSEATLNRVGDALGLHELAREDALHRRQRPKVDRYDNHLFLTAYTVSPDARHTHEISAFITPRALITVHGGDVDMSEVTRRWDGTAHLADSGAAHLLHGLLDHTADTHAAAADTLEDHLDTLEDRVFADDRDPTLTRDLLATRRALTTLRRTALPMREVIAALTHPDHGVTDHTTAPYFHDLADHALRTAEHTTALRETLTTIRETQLTVQGNRLNLIMKKVTGWAAVIAVPTAITGFYGQNVPYPGSGQPWGFWTSTAATALLSIGLYALFKRKDWL
ncbi:magnesium transporter CorA family protein [Actinokineospora guangxiensis]|uniref:Magnesium transporter CorA family protein n=1 Tax=Actinokineospora guangxiensis TaxID=1490288 RepID=A0ABW0ES45_9PSEU